MKTVMIAAVAGFAGLATANPFLHQAGERAPNTQAPRGTALTTVINLTNVESRDALRAPINIVQNVNLGANAQVIGIGWDLTIETIGFSWRNEARVAFEDSALSTGVFLTPGTDASPGFGSYSSGGIVNLVDLALDFTVGADGVLRLEFWESFVDNPGAADAILNGSLTIQYVPTPGALAVLGLGGLVATRRRR